MCLQLEMFSSRDELDKEFMRMHSIPTVSAISVKNREKLFSSSRPCASEKYSAESPMFPTISSKNSRAPCFTRLSTSLEFGVSQSNLLMFGLRLSLSRKAVTRTLSESPFEDFWGADNFGGWKVMLSSESENWSVKDGFRATECSGASPITRRRGGSR